MLSCHLKWSVDLICIKTTSAKIHVVFSFKLDWFADTVYRKVACAGRKGRVRLKKKWMSRVWGKYRTSSSSYSAI